MMDKRTKKQSPFKFKCGDKVRLNDYGCEICNVTPGQGAQGTVKCLITTEYAIAITREVKFVRDNDSFGAGIIVPESYLELIKD